MALKFISVIIFNLVFISFVASETEQICYTIDSGIEFCTEGEDDKPCYYEDPVERLFQWDPVAVGHERELELEDGKTFKMITKSMKPKLFVIPNFLTDIECEHIIGMADATGMFSSKLHIDALARKSKKYTHGRSRAAVSDFTAWDENKDGEISIDEIKKFAIKTRFLYIDEEHIKKMFEDLEITSAEDGVISWEEFQFMSTDSIDEYMKDLRENHPKFRDRYSEQAWLRQGKMSDRIMQKLRRRVARLTRLPPRIAKGCEPMQVVKYDQHGHYHAHYDGQDRSQFPNLECCHFVADKVGECRLCRFITVLFYLNDVEAGGETAFPAADKDGFSQETFQRRETGDGFNLSQFCHNATVVVPPKKGTAVLWYNHHVDDTTGWMGARDEFTLHGGCDIIKGTKWVANNWFTAPEADSFHLTSLYSMEDDIFEEEGQDKKKE